MDFNGDGYNDIISGSWPGELYLFSGNADGTFAKSTRLRDQDGALIDEGSASAVYAVDWNDDGDLDLIVGNISGDVHLLTNEGTRNEPAFGDATPLRAGDKQIKAPGGDAGPTVVDWDDDSRLDLIVGCGDGSVLWYRNTGTDEDGSVQLAPAQPLIEKRASYSNMGTSTSEPAPGMRAKVHAVDYNNDGLLDLLVGDFGTETVHEEELTEQQRAEKAELDQAWRDLIDEYEAIIREHGAASETGREELATLTDRLNELSRKRAQYRQVGDFAYRGNVWLMLRKPAEQAETAGEG